LPNKKIPVRCILLGAGVHFSLKLKMKKKKRVPYNNMFNAELIKGLKILAAEQDKRQNDLFEEAIQDLLKKYGKKMPQDRV
jgi:hypothetical protein